ncbi:MAG: sigma-70 family RNA polymerase sigma factor [Verrucomicrobia bacterium]|nr:sigma-70 family RNA polymerase sigma factor [Verrucomicrobiota bacterium]
MQKPSQSENESRSQSGSANDATNITRLLLEHRSALMAYILAAVRNHADADDIFQESSLAIATSFSQLREENGFLPWAREIARRRILAHVRKHKQLLLIDDELLDKLCEAAERIDLMEQRRAESQRKTLHTCLEQLPTESRRMIAMRYDSPTPPVESIAQQFGRSVQGTYALLKRIRLVLRDCVDNKLSQEGSA